MKVLRIEIEMAARQPIAFHADRTRTCRAIIRLIGTCRRDRWTSVHAKGEIPDENVTVIGAGERHRSFVVRRRRDSVIVVGMHGAPGHCFGPMLLNLRV